MDLTSHTAKLLTLSTKAYMYASTPSFDIKKRAICIEFLSKLNSSYINLTYEGESFDMHMSIYGVLCIIKSIHGPKVAVVEALRLYPELVESSWITDAINSSMFEVKEQEK